MANSAGPRPLLTHTRLENEQHQYPLRLLEVFDVGAYSIPHRDLPGFVAEWRKANQEPTKDSVMAAHARFDVTWFSGAQLLPPFFHQ